MTHWRTLIERESIAAWDLVGKDGKPRDFTLEIIDVRQQKVKSQENPKGKGKPIIRFRGAEKYFIAGAVNCKAIAGMYGDDVDAWVGKSITLYATVTDVGPNKNVPCVRVRPTKPKGKTDAELPSQPVDPAMRAAQDAAFSSNLIVGTTTPPPGYIQDFGDVVWTLPPRQPGDD